MTLTGRQRFRVGLFGRLILQVEENTNEDYGLRWRDAKLEDITTDQRDLKPTHDFENAQLLLE